MSTTNPTWGTLTDPVTVTLDAMSSVGWRMLHETRWPGHPGHSLAHVAVGPGGVVVILTPQPTVHPDAVDGPQEDQACATASVTALVAPRHRRTVSGVLVVPPGTDAPTRARVVDSQHLEAFLGSLDPVLSPLEVVLVSAYLRDKLDPVPVPRRSDRVPNQPAPSVDRSVPEPPAAVARRPWWRLRRG